MGMRCVEGKMHTSRTGANDYDIVFVTIDCGERRWKLSMVDEGMCMLLFDCGHLGRRA